MNVVVSTEKELRRVVREELISIFPLLTNRDRPDQSPSKEWLTNKEAREFLGLSKTTLQRYRASGQLPFSKIGGNVYYRYADLVAVLEQHLVQ